jgi:hypothetical protein
MDALPEQFFEFPQRIRVPASHIEDSAHFFASQYALHQLFKCLVLSQVFEELVIQFQ